MNAEKPSLLDSVVDWIAGLMDGLGLNGKRLRWKWRQHRHNLGETGMKTEMAWRSAKAKHKMCPECRALIDRSARTCPDCGASMSRVSTPGVTRSLGNLFPGLNAVTGLILLVNGFMFLLLMMAHAKAGLGVRFFGSFDSEMLVRFGSGLSFPVRLSDDTITGGEWWRLITPIFLHAGMLHFFFNSFLLVQLGPVVQEIYGARYWVIYLTCGIAGSMASQLPRDVNSIGASGAILGLIGLLLVHSWRGRSQLGQAMKSMTMRLLIYTVVLSIVFPIDHHAHAGGFICGGLLALLLPTGEPKTGGERTLWSVLSLLAVLLVLISFGMVAGLEKYL